jgi:predicted RNA-binding Zn-ribbon protein involved in translation (DUF1610 family)
MKYILFIIVGLLILLYFQKQKKVRKRLQVVKSHRTKLAEPAYCPYCNKQLEKRPVRNTKCPMCGAKIILRKGQLLTEEQAAAYDTKELVEQRKSIEANHMATLIGYKKSGVVEYVEICGGGQNSCPACQSLSGKRFLLKDALRNPPLPVKNCTSVYGFCRCCYVAVVE